MTNEQIFTTFLKSHRKFSSAKRNFRPPNTSFLPEPYSVKKAINYSLVWINTEEGHHYWRERNFEWLQMCEDLNITGTIKLSEVFK